MHSIHFQPLKRMSHDDILEFSRLNQGLFCEMNANGSVCLRQPFPPLYRRIIAQVIAAIEAWITETSADMCAFDTELGYVLPNGAVRFPALSGIKSYKINTQIEHLLETAPDFCLDFLGPTDNLAAMRSRMKEYIANGTLSCWLVDAVQARVVVFKNDGSEILLTLEQGTVTDDALLKGFKMPIKMLFLSR